jgi:hypothetical protein
MCLADYGVDLQKSAAQNMATTHHHHHPEPEQEGSKHHSGTDCKHPSFDNAESVQSFRLIHAIPQIEALVVASFASSTFNNEPLRNVADFHSPPETTDTRILSLRI